MPFTQRPQPDQPAQPPRDPMYRVTGLYPSKNGSALTGNLNLDVPTRDTNGLPMGEFLIDYIRVCMELGRPLRFLVFEAKDPNARVPYNLNITLGQQKIAEPDWQQPVSQHPEAPYETPSAPQAPPPPPPDAWGPSPSQPTQPAPSRGEAVPRPRVAPRR